MSHSRKIISLIVLALVGWLTVFGAVGAVSATASATSSPATAAPASVCC